MKAVELQAAYHYHCEECGEPNFVMPIAAEMSPEEHEEYFRRFHDMDVEEMLRDYAAIEGGAGISHREFFGGEGRGL